MEDECVPLVMRVPADQTELTSRIYRLSQVAGDLAALAAAAGVLVRLREERS